ncbi:MAG TPA: hypothetical protein VNK89_00020 [Thermoflexus sp.]|nr:hypothetical protein [Thermoflexus sp.]
MSHGPTKRSAMRLYRFFGALVLGLAACSPSRPQPSIPLASPTPSWAPSPSPTVPPSTPLPTYTPHPSLTPTASARKCIVESAGLPDLASLRWEDRTLGPHRVRVLDSLPLPPIPTGLTPDGRFLEVLFFTPEGEATREALVALDLAGTAHQLVQAPSGSCPLADWALCLYPEWLRRDPTLAERNRLPDGRRLRIDEAGRVRVEDGETLTVDTPVPFVEVYPAGANSALGFGEIGQLWRGTLRPPTWERVQDAQGRPLRGRWVLPVRSADGALAVEAVFESVSPTATPRSPQVEPGTRGPSPLTPTPHIPGPGAPVVFHFWRVPLKPGAPAVQQSTFRTEVIGTDMPTPDPVLLRDGRHVVLYWPSIVVEGLWSISALVDVETGQRVAEGVLGLPEGTVLVDVMAIADGRWVLGEVVDQRTRQGRGIWVALGEDLSRHWTFEGWRGVQTWHPAGKGVVVQAGTMAEPKRLGVLRLPPGAEGVRPLEGMQPPVGWAGDWVVGRVATASARVVLIWRGAYWLPVPAEAPVKVRAVNPEGRVEELDLSTLGTFLADVQSGRDRVWLVVGTEEPGHRCHYTLVEWAP